MSKRFKEAIALRQASFSFQLQALNEKLDANHRHMKDHLDSLGDQIGNLENLINYLHRDHSFSSPSH